jgi:hypothetical protein
VKWLTGRLAAGAPWQPREPEWRALSQWYDGGAMAGGADRLRIASRHRDQMSLRVIFNALLVAGLAVAGGCSPAPDGPSPIPPPDSPGPLVETTVRVVSALDQQVGLPQVALSVANGREQQTDVAGLSAILAKAPVTAPLRLLHPAFIERETAVRIPADAPVDLSLIPSTHDLTAFEEFSPRAAGLRRWTRNPRLLVLTHAVDYSRATLGFREYPVVNLPIGQAQLECLAAGVADSLAEMSGGHLGWESIDIAEVEPGTRFRTDQTPEGTIVVLPSISLGASGRGTAYVGDDPFILSRGAIWMSTTLNSCLISLLYRHELGHALGYLHVTRTLSVMSTGLAPALTGFDRDSIAILFQRRPGNRLPDRDPSGVSVNVTGSAARRHDVEPMR